MRIKHLDFRPLDLETVSKFSVVLEVRLQAGVLHLLRRVRAESTLSLLWARQSGQGGSVVIQLRGGPVLWKVEEALLRAHVELVLVLDVDEPVSVGHGVDGGDRLHWRCLQRPPGFIPVRREGGRALSAVLAPLRAPRGALLNEDVDLVERLLSHIDHIHVGVKLPRKILGVLG